MESRLRDPNGWRRALRAAFTLTLLSTSAVALQVVPGTPPSPPSARDDAATGPDLPNWSEGLTPDGRATVLVELEPVPAVAAGAAASRRLAASSSEHSRRASAAAAARRQLAAIEAAQLELLTLLESRSIGATVLYRVQRIYNGVAIEVDPALLEVVKSLPGVKAVHPLAPASRTMASSSRLLDAPQMWSSRVPNVTGKGVRIGVIDGGVDYLHTGLGGPGSGYAGNDTTIVGDSPHFPGPRVVGGWDFVGDGYDPASADPARRVPHPDPDPMDCDGHGTFAAGIAAGSGVGADGASFAGPYGPETPFDALRIGPGIAPEADIYALRVFGCTGPTAMEIAALEWAVDPDGDGDPSDHLDVVNLSIGGAYLYPLGNPVTIASDNASLAGVAVVRAANNDGDTYYVAASESDHVLIVAASADGTAIRDGLAVTAPAAIAGEYPAEFSPDFDWHGMDAPIAGPLAYPASQPSGCAAFDSANAGLLAGKAALLDPGGCSVLSVADHAADAGAIGVVLAVAQAYDWMDARFASSSRIPLVVVPGATGDLLKANLASGVSVRFDTALLDTQKVVEPDWEDMLGRFSARGPRQGDSALRPDVTAPGVTITAPRSGSGSFGDSLDGTSFATPHAAGAMALLRQLHPEWSNDELKALLMNTATHDLFSDAGRTPPIYGLARIGAGRLDLGTAAASEIIAFDADHPALVSLSFGVVDVVGTASVARTVRVVNEGASPALLSLSVQVVTEVPGVEISLPGGTALTVPGNGTATFPVVLEANASEMKHTRDATVAGLQSGAPRHWISEHGGYVVLTPASGPALRLPVYAAPRPASSLAAAVDRLVVAGSGGTFPLPIAGTGVNTGPAYPLDERAWLMPMELQAESPPLAVDDFVAVSDLRWVGVASNAKQMLAQGGSVADATVWFGIATYRPWSTPNTRIVLIVIDTDGDGIGDHAVFTAWFGSNGSGGRKNPTDVFVARTCNISSGSCWNDAYINDWPASSYDTVLFNTNIMYLPVRAWRIGLTDAHSRFSYWVRTSAEEVPGGFIDSTTPLTYDPARPGLDFGGTSYFDGPGTLSVVWDRAAFEANGSLGALLLHHHNAGDSKAEVVPVHVARPTRRHLRGGPHG